MKTETRNKIILGGWISIAVFSLLSVIVGLCKLPVFQAVTCSLAGLTAITLAMFLNRYVAKLVDDLAVERTLNTAIAHNASLAATARDNAYAKVKALDEEVNSLRKRIDMHDLDGDGIPDEGCALSAEMTVVYAVGCDSTAMMMFANYDKAVAAYENVRTLYGDESTPYIDTITLSDDATIGDCPADDYEHDDTPESDYDDYE